MVRVWGSAWLPVTTGFIASRWLEEIIWLLIALLLSAALSHEGWVPVGSLGQSGGAHWQRQWHSRGQREEREAVTAFS